MSEEKELYDDKNDDVTAETETEETEERIFQKEKR